MCCRLRDKWARLERANSPILDAKKCFAGVRTMNDRRIKNHRREQGTVPTVRDVRAGHARARLTDDLQERELNMMFNRHHKTA